MSGQLSHALSVFPIANSDASHATPAARPTPIPSHLAPASEFPWSLIFGQRNTCEDGDSARLSETLRASPKCGSGKTSLSRLSSRNHPPWRAGEAVNIPISATCVCRDDVYSIPPHLVRMTAQGRWPKAVTGLAASTSLAQTRERCECIRIRFPSPSHPHPP